MKTIFIICLLVWFVFVDSIAQQWVQVKPTFNSTKKLNTYHSFFSDENNGWWITLYPGTVLHTTNKGIDWETQVESSNAGIGDIIFLDSLHGWIRGGTIPNPNPSYFILNTSNGGNIWNKYDTPQLRCFSFFDTLVGFAGGGYNIYKTINGGITWDSMLIKSSRGGKAGVKDIFFVDQKRGWAVGSSAYIFDIGVILNTVDSGKTWHFLDTMTNINLAVTFTDSLHGYAVGGTPPYSGGVIQVTNNGGLSWIRHNLPSSWLNDVVFTDDSSGWVVGDYGFIWHTTDQGLNWTQVESGTTSDLYRIFFFNNGEIGYILGADSTILKYEKTVDIKDSESVSVSEYKLFQNYPNPFNSSTQIAFKIPENGSVAITIYDLLGKEVKTLLSEEKPKGSYTVTWDAKDGGGRIVSTGIYFCQLRSKFINSTHKLVLIK